jgi:pilus assembly protein CpaE
MPVYLLDEKVSHPKAAEAKATLKSAIPELRHAASLDAVVRSAGSVGDPAIAVAVLPNKEGHDFDALADFAAELPRNVFLVIVGAEISASQYKRLVRTGAADWVPMPFDVGEIIEIISRRRNAVRQPAAGSRNHPVTISFVPSAGGVGNTTLAIEVAAYIKTDRATRERAICLVDLDFQSSHVCDYLDSEPRLQIGDLCSAPERLDDQLFESFRARHGSGIDVFAAPRRSCSIDDIKVEALDSLLTMIARRYDVILIILPLFWFSWTPQIIAASDGAVVAGRNTVQGLRQVSETVERVRSSGVAELSIRVVLNRCERTFFGSISNRKHAETALRDERIFFVGQRPEAIDSVNLGIPMLLGPAARKVRREFAALGGFCAELKSVRAS